jgi:serine/threonine-protein kinase
MSASRELSSENGPTIQAPEDGAGTTPRPPDMPSVEDPIAPTVCSPQADPSPGQATFSTDPGPIERTPSETTVVTGYEILGELGRGGMGVVYKARQIRLKRLVALKLVLAGPHAGPAHLARFQLEAQAAARLQHPHVVQVYEIGEQDGRSYFSLEFVEGGSLAQKLAAGPLSAEAAARLLVTLAGTIHFAHQHGVIHRDLKPANVLLTADDTAKVADFGLAKQLDSDAGHTQSGALLGTPSYMAPEQARGQVQAIGPATDVYALGAILYECLTGRPPFRGITVLDTLEQVQTQEPVPPSRLQPKLPRDLETICLKCLQKEQGRRYASAEALANDLSRFLRGDSIEARPTPAMERLLVWSRRRPAVAALLAVILLAVLILVGGSLWYNAQLQRAINREKSSAAEARTQQERAEAHFAKAQEAVNRLLTRVGEQRLVDVPGMDQLRGELLQDALQFYQGFLREQDAPTPAVRHETALAHMRVGLIQQLLGQREVARQHNAEARQMLQTLADEHPDAPTYAKDLAQAHLLAGDMDQEDSQRESAESHYRAALALWNRLRQEHPEDAGSLRAMGQAYNNLGNLLVVFGQMDEAEQVFKQALALRRQLAEGALEADERRHDVAQTFHNLAGLFQRTNRADEAETHYREARDLFGELVRRSPRSVLYQSELAACESDLATLYNGTGRRQEAEETYERAISRRDTLAREHPGVPSFQTALANSYYSLAGLYRHTGRRDEAEKAYQKAIALLTPTSATEKESVSPKALAECHLAVGAVYEETNRPEKAESAYRQAATILEPLARAHPDAVETGEVLGKVYFHLGHLLAATGKKEEAIDWCGRSIALLEPILEKYPQRSLTRLTLRGSYAQRAILLEESGQMWSSLRDLWRWKTLEKSPPLSRMGSSRR